ncbi:hypothetical protein F2Q70_00001474 [Brassica cretica]|uniref:RNase H type-1 domain-containing protein n=1 Tax=Brassica cretica TaxID=69181 RepID=A0A8S9IK61_BRACR|nr:hypothetical protein F2Q70_00001474 [Brassica cretica]
MWMGMGGQHWKCSTYGDTNHVQRESPLHSEVETLRWTMENMLQHSTCQNFGINCKDLIDMIKEPRAWPSFATELERIETLQICFSDFKITYVPRAQNQISDSLAMTAILIWVLFIIVSNKSELQSCAVYSVIHGFTPVGRANHYMPSLKADSIVKVDRLELQARLQSGKFKWNDIPTIETASVMDSYLPRIALTMVYGKKNILLLKKDCDNPVNSPFQAEQQMEANFSGSSSTSRQNQKIDVDQPPTPKDDTSCICDEVIEKINSTDVDDLVSLATILVLENLYESPTVICVNETIESLPTESAPIKQHTESSVTQTSAEVIKESTRRQEIDLGSNQFAFLTSLEREEEYQLELDESSGQIDLLTPSGKRLLRERPVRPSAKGMEWQLQSTSRGRGNRRHGNRGKIR